MPRLSWKKTEDVSKDQEKEFKVGAETDGFTNTEADCQEQGCKWHQEGAASSKTPTIKLVTLSPCETLGQPFCLVWGVLFLFLLLPQSFLIGRSLPTGWSMPVPVAFWSSTQLVCSLEKGEGRSERLSGVGESTCQRADKETACVQRVQRVERAVPGRYRLALTRVWGSSLYSVCTCASQFYLLIYLKIF